MPLLTRNVLTIYFLFAPITPFSNFIFSLGINKILKISDINFAHISIMKAVLTMSTGPPVQDQYNFVWTSTFFSFYLDIHVYI